MGTSNDVALLDAEALPTDDELLEKEVGPTDKHAPRVMFIHVGKTGGSTVNAFLTHAKIPNLTVIHATSREWNQKDKYFPFARGGKHNYHILVSVRDPIDRVISSFNWRRHFKDINHRLHPWEQNFYAHCAKTPNEFAHSLKSKTACGKLARIAADCPGNLDRCESNHVGMGHRFYFPPDALSKLVSSHAKVWLVRQESMEHDLKQFMSSSSDYAHIRMPKIEHVRSIYKGSNNTHLDTRARRVLCDELTKIGEYEVLNTLEKIAQNGHRRWSC
jgi:hypothetical protein